MTEKYHIKENGFDEIKKKTLVTTVPIILLAGSVGIVIAHYNRNPDAKEINTLPYIIPLFALIFFYSIFKLLKKQKEIFNSFILTINEDEISREQNLLPRIEIPIAEITKITKTANGSFIIQGKSVKNMIIIPAQIENGAALEEQLSGIKSITIKDKNLLSKILVIIVPIVTIGLMATVILSENRLFILIAGIAVTGMMLYSFVSIQNSKEIDHKTKRGSWFILLIIISICVYIYNKLFIG